MAAVRANAGARMDEAQATSGPSTWMRVTARTGRAMSEAVAAADGER
jgi:hypothetical protein